LPQNNGHSINDTFCKFFVAVAKKYPTQLYSMKTDDEEAYYAKTEEEQLKGVIKMISMVGWFNPKQFMQVG
jgi:hypothetical protein